MAYKVSRNNTKDWHRVEVYVCIVKASQQAVCAPAISFFSSVLAYCLSVHHVWLFVELLIFLIVCLFA